MIANLEDAAGEGFFCRRFGNLAYREENETRSGRVVLRAKRLNGTTRTDPSFVVSHGTGSKKAKAIEDEEFDVSMEGCYVKCNPREGGNMRRLMILLGLLAFSFLWTIPAAKGAGSYDFTTFDVPFAPFPGGVNTEGDGINNLGQVVGDYANGTDNILHGYLRDPNGSFTRIDVPSFLSQNSTFDFPPDLNNSGVIVGRYRIFSGPALGEHCYVLIAGVFIPIPDIPFPHTPFPHACRGINDIVTPGQPVGQIVGEYRDPLSFRRHGFLLSGGVFSTIDFPGATHTSSRRINNQGQIVGRYWFDNGPFHGFLLSGGVFSSIDFPGAIETEALDINNHGQIVGDYVDTDSHVHGFLFANGTFTTIALPGVIQNADGSTIFNLNFNVGIAGINDAGVITGTFLGSDGNFHGFVGVPQNSQ